MKLFLGSKFILLVDGRYAGTVEVQRFEKFPKTALIGNFSIFFSKIWRKIYFQILPHNIFDEIFFRKISRPLGKPARRSKWYACENF